MRTDLRCAAVFLDAFRRSLREMGLGRAIPKAGSCELPVRARYTVRDYNFAEVEISTYLGNAKIEMLPGQALHYVFLFKTNGKATRLDTGGVWSRKGTVTVGTVSGAAACEFYDAPYSIQ